MEVNALNNSLHNPNNLSKFAGYFPVWAHTHRMITANLFGLFLHEVTASRTRYCVADPLHAQQRASYNVNVRVNIAPKIENSQNFVSTRALHN